jgi:4-hydroxy-2-oxoheptanedioate aldolase
LFYSIEKVFLSLVTQIKRRINKKNKIGMLEMAFENYFKKRLKTQQQIGLWVGLADAYGTEIAANAGYDWLLIDGEHAPSDLRTTLAQLQSIAAYPSQAVVRPPIGSVQLIKQLLDIGAQTLLIPMIETVEQAELMVKAVRYPPYGVRGVGAALARATRWNSIPNYYATAHENICLLIQIESVVGLANLDAILKVDGIDGIFIGAVDLSATMGYEGNPNHPEVQKAVIDAIKRIRVAGKAAGILSTMHDVTQQYLDLGTEFVAVGVDTSVLMNSLRDLLARYKTDAHRPQIEGGY